MRTDEKSNKVWEDDEVVAHNFESTVSREASRTIYPD